MAIQVNRAERKDIGAIALIFRNPPADFRKLNIGTNILSSIDWSHKRLGKQGKAGGIFVAKDSGALVGFGMPVTYKIEIMDSPDAISMQAGFAGTQGFYAGEKKAIASYRACYENASFVMFLPHETKDAADIYRLMLENIVAAARAMRGIRKLSGTMPREHRKIPESLGMLNVKGTEMVYEITFDQKKIRPRRIKLHSPSQDCENPYKDIGMNEDGRMPRKERNFC